MVPMVACAPFPASIYPVIQVSRHRSAHAQVVIAATAFSLSAPERPKPRHARRNEGHGVVEGLLGRTVGISGHLLCAAHDGVMVSALGLQIRPVFDLDYPELIRRDEVRRAVRHFRSAAGGAALALGNARRPPISTASACPMRVKSRLSRRVVVLGRKEHRCSGVVFLDHSHIWIGFRGGLGVHG